MLRQIASGKLIKLLRNHSGSSWFVGEKFDLFGDLVETRIIVLQQSSETSSNIHIRDTR